MPVHRIPRATMHEDIRSIEREGEQIVSVSGDGPDHLLVATIWFGTAALETRTHQHRLGTAS